MSQHNNGAAHRVSDSIVDRLISARPLPSPVTDANLPRSLRGQRVSWCAHRDGRRVGRPASLSGRYRQDAIFGAQRSV